MASGPSGLAISAALDVRDNNEASWTQILEVLGFMADATRIPTMLDGDTGYGNFNNFRRLLRKLCQGDVAAVCIEDKVFPKINSFIGRTRPLAEVEEFCGKIRAKGRKRHSGPSRVREPGQPSRLSPLSKRLRTPSPSCVGAPCRAWLSRNGH